MKTNNAQEGTTTMGTPQDNTGTTSNSTTSDTAADTGTVTETSKTTEQTTTVSNAASTPTGDSPRSTPPPDRASTPPAKATAAKQTSPRGGSSSGHKGSGKPSQTTTRTQPGSVQRQPAQSTQPPPAQSSTSTGSSAKPAPLSKEQEDRVRELMDDGVPPQLAFMALGVDEPAFRRFYGIKPSEQLTSDLVLRKVYGIKPSDPVNNRTISAAQARQAHLLNRVHQGTTLANSRAAALERDMDQVKTNMAVLARELFGSGNDVDEALKAGHKGGRRSFYQALKRKGHDDAKIREFLTVMDETKPEDMDDSDMFVSVLEEQASMRADLNTVTNRVDDHEGRITVIESKTGISKKMWGLAAIVGILVGLVVWLWWLTHDWSTNTTSGNMTFHNGMLAEQWIVAVLMGVFSGIVAAALVILLANRSGSKKSSSEHATDESHEDEKVAHSQRKPIRLGPITIERKSKDQNQTEKANDGKKLGADPNTTQTVNVGGIARREPVADTPQDASSNDNASSHEPAVATK